MVALGERMLELNKRRGGLGPPAARSQTGAQRTPLPPEAEHLEREIAATENIRRSFSVPRPFPLCLCG
jgi:hypothetical protein